MNATDDLVSYAIEAAKISYNKGIADAITAILHGVETSERILGRPITRDEFVEYFRHAAKLAEGPVK